MTDESSETTAAPGPKENPGKPHWPAGYIFLVGILFFVSGQMTTEGTAVADRLAISAVPLGLLLAWWVAQRLSPHWWPQLLAALYAHDKAIDAIPAARVGTWIILASAIGLYVELMLIRWHGAMFYLFALYKNVSLLAAFLGLGIGFARSAIRPIATPLVLPAVALQFLVLYALCQTSLQGDLHNPVIEQTAMGLQNAQTISSMLLAYGFLLLVFALTVLTCVPLGQLAARLMNRQAPLAAYSANLIGSLIGILSFTALSYLWSPPAIWLLGAALAMGCVLSLGASKWSVIPSVAATAAALALLAAPLTPDLTWIYSPYQALTLELRRGDTPKLLANHSYFQHILDLSQKAQEDDPETRRAATYYELPYAFKKKPENVLIVGSGTGNDVAAALRRGAKHVDAVEIDPAIIDVGRRLHPESPYQDPRTTAIVNDARTFIRNTDNTYDLIVYGLLDSHSQLSNMSSVRLDSFVYTVESFREARARLKPGGLIVMTFCLSDFKQGRKLFDMVSEAFDGIEPKAYEANYDFGVTYVIGEKFPRRVDVPVQEITDKLKAIKDPVEVSTDDWPFLYMSERTYPLTYVLVIGLLLAVSAGMVRQLLPAGTGKLQPVPFFLGAGFMLVETKSITELGLTLGNTWHVISVVIAGILTMAYLANRIIERRGTMPNAATYSLIIATLLLGFGVSLQGIGGLPPLLTVVATVAVLSAPIFFSGFAFSSYLAKQTEVSAALSSNLLGAMLGGFLEYNSMYFGFRSLYIFAIVLYALAFLASVRRSQA